MVDGLAGLNLTYVQAQSVEFLEARVQLLVGDVVLRGDATDLLHQAGAALEVLTLCTLTALANGGLDGLDRASLGVDGAGSLHGRGRGGTGDSSLTAGWLLLLDLAGTGGGLRGTVTLRGGEVVDTTHVVV